MSTSPEFVDEDLKTDMKSALFAVLMCVLAFGVGYYFFGRKVVDSARAAEASRQNQLAAEEQLQTNTLIANDIQSQVNAIQSRVAQGEGTGPVGESLNERLSVLQAQLNSISTQAENVQGQIDRSISRAARLEAKNIAADALVTRCEESLQRLQSLIVRWHVDYLPVFEDDRGRKLANDRATVGQFATLSLEPLATERDVTDWTLEVQAVAQPIRHALQTDTEYEIDDENWRYLEQLITRVDEACKRHMARQDFIERKLLQYQSAEVAPKTLSQAIADYEHQVMLDLTAQATEQRRTELQKLIEEQSKTILAAEQKELDANTQVRMAEIEAARVADLERKRQLEESIARALAETQKKQLEAEFRRDEAELRALLTPFLMKSESQPVVGDPDNMRTWFAAGEYGASSFGRLQGSGCLDETAEGIRRLYYYGGSDNNLRHKGGFPHFTETGLNNPNIVARVSRARELLRKYGPLLVEKGMLQR